jgi:hypothetical protein
MSQPIKFPDPDKVKQRVQKMHEVFTVFDEQIAVLDQLIAQTESENKKNPFNIYCQKRKQQRLEAQQRERSEEPMVQSD